MGELDLAPVDWEYLPCCAALETDTAPTRESYDSAADDTDTPLLRLGAAVEMETAPTRASEGRREALFLLGAEPDTGKAPGICLFPLSISLVP
jgi:hypothetical protein